MVTAADDDKSCVNAQNEFSMYKWKEDRNGVPVSPPRPVDKFNHIIDALRYALEEDMHKTTATVKPTVTVTNYLRGEDKDRDRPGW
jgi:phage terminase large subunit